jgi:hypothetical protein
MSILATSRFRRWWPPILTSASFQTPLLEGLTPYFWRVVARDELGEETSGPLWKFTTSNGSPPGAPSNPNPPHQSVIGNSFPTLTWTCSDPDDQPLTYTVHFGTTEFAIPPAVAVVTSPQYSPPGPLVPFTYHWYVEVSDGTFNNVSVSVWTFTVNPTVATESTTWGRIKALYKD